MTPGLFDRIAILVKADAHGVVDALEERSLLVKQYLREAELELLQKRARIEALAEEEKRLRDELGRAREEARRLDEDVALALGGEKEELARFAIRRLLPLRQRAASLETGIAEVGEARQRLAERLAAQQQQLDELRSRARTRLAGRGPQASLEELLGAPAPDEAEVELEQLRRRRAAVAGKEPR
jgi:phage shock protein A